MTCHLTNMPQYPPCETISRSDLGFGALGPSIAPATLLRITAWCIQFHSKQYEIGLSESFHLGQHPTQKEKVFRHFHMTPDSDCKFRLKCSMATTQHDWQEGLDVGKDGSG